MVSAVVNRREMLQIVGGAAAAGIVPARAEAQPRSFGSDEVVDVAVVGAGISGLYSAWRLRTETRGSTARPQRSSSWRPVSASEEGSCRLLHRGFRARGSNLAGCDFQPVIGG